MIELHIAPTGNDQWSGRLPSPAANGEDGPLAGLQGAIRVLRELRHPTGRDGAFWSSTAALTEPVTVWVHDGIYPMTAPAVFGPEDSVPVIFKPLPGTTPVFSGGIHIRDWESILLDGVTVWTAPLPDAVPAHHDLRQLFVNGRRARRARWPDTGFLQIEDPLVPESLRGWQKTRSDRFVAAEGDIPPALNLEDVELVVLHYWVEERFGVHAFDPQTRQVVLDRKSRSALIEAEGCGGARYFLENVRERLRRPGDWAASARERRLWYVPLPTETLEPSTFVLPVIPQLIRLEGRPEQEAFVQWIRFEGLTFRYTSAPDPGTSAEPASRIHADDNRSREKERLACASQAAVDVPGVIYARGARHCRLSNCILENIGWYGMDLDQGCHHLRIDGNIIRDAGAGGIRINGTAAGSPVRTQTSNCNIHDNHLHDLGNIFHSAVGILSRNAWRIVIEHNSIHDLYYTGISCGWVWGYGPTVTREVLIAHNHIYRVGKGRLNDMGGIYTLGGQAGTVIRHNHIHDIDCARYGGWAIYPDEGSSHLVIEKNLCYRTNRSVFHQHYGRENIVRNNIFALGGEGVVSLSRRENEISFTLMRNILLSADGYIFLGGYACDPDRSGGIAADLNLVWDVHTGAEIDAARRKHVSGRDVENLNERWSWSAWQERGRDRHGTVADPGFRDPLNGDFTLKERSPAQALGFEPFDVSTAGVRPVDRRPARL